MIRTEIDKKVRFLGGDNCASLIPGRVYTAHLTYEGLITGTMYYCVKEYEPLRGFKCEYFDDVDIKEEDSGVDNIFEEKIKQLKCKNI